MLIAPMAVTTPPSAAPAITAAAPAPTRAVAASGDASDAGLARTKAGAGAMSLVPGDAPRSISTALESVRDAVRDLFGRRPTAPLPTNGSVDLKRYSGLWYELARLPVRFQDPQSVSTAEYGIRSDGSVEVKNTAYVGDTVSARITGRATAARGAEATNDRLRVRFGGLLRFIPVPKDGNYWIIDAADDYSTALVGTPDRKFLWLLSRDKDAWGTRPIDALVDKAKSLGFDTDRLLVADWERRRMRDAGA